jgi:hypothetical protein
MRTKGFLFSASAIVLAVAVAALAASRVTSEPTQKADGRAAHACCDLPECPLCCASGDCCEECIDCCLEMGCEPLCCFPTAESAKAEPSKTVGKRCTAAPTAATCSGGSCRE